MIELYEKDFLGRYIHWIECNICGRELRLSSRVVEEDKKRGIVSTYLLCQCGTKTCVEVFNLKPIEQLFRERK